MACQATLTLSATGKVACTAHRCKVVKSVVIRTRAGTSASAPPPKILYKLRHSSRDAELKARIKSVPFTIHLTCATTITCDALFHPAKRWCSVDGCLGFNGSRHQRNGKTFLHLLYLFLSRTYKNVEVVFIRHHTQAKEVDENEFFYSQETGGTIVSSAWTHAWNSKKRYASEHWNIYGTGIRWW